MKNASEQLLSVICPFHNGFARESASEQPQSILRFGKGFVRECVSEQIQSVILPFPAGCVRQALQNSTSL